MKFLEERDATGEFRISKEAIGTAKVLKFFDTLMDSLNGGTLRGDTGKPLKGAVCNKSAHIALWQQSKHDLKNMYFQREGTTEKVVPPSLKNFVLTVESFIDLSEILLQKLPYFFARSFNQDPLENYFGQMRQHRGRNINPTCTQFKQSYKALLVRSIASSHSIYSNCEETFESTLLQLQDLCKYSTPQRPIDSSNDFPDNVNIYREIAALDEVSLMKPLGKAIAGYVSGYIGKKVLPTLKCDFCKSHILRAENTSPSPYNILINAKEYNSSVKALKYCNDYFIACIHKSFNIARIVVANCYERKNVCSIICAYIKQFVHFSFICDHRGEIISCIIRFVAQMCIFTICKRANSIIHGKERLTSNTNCKLLKVAHECYQKRRK